MIDLNSSFGKRASHRLMEEEIIWLTTTDKHGAPQPRPVLFLWDGDTILIFSQPRAHKVSHIEQHNRVALNLDSADYGEDIVVILGNATILSTPVPEEIMDAYIMKYREGLERINFTTEQFKRDYNLAIRITPTALRGN
jgi:PPOX class probable F420-dependent enzyme